MADTSARRFRVQQGSFLKGRARLCSQQALQPAGSAARLCLVELRRAAAYRAMPKQKHNKLQKKNKVGSADFKKNFDIKKKKGKVGKGKVAGANATSTEINAKALAMPHSSILKASKEERGLVTQRNLSLDELLVQTRHVNAGVRKEALAGLRELITDHGVMLRVRMSDILGRAVELLLDSDQGTRQALQDLLRTAFQQINEVRAGRHTCCRVAATRLTLVVPVDAANNRTVPGATRRVHQVSDSALHSKYAARRDGNLARGY